MTPAELDRFLRQLIEDMTVIRGWTYLAMRVLPHDAPQRHHLEQMEHRVMLTAQLIQEQFRTEPQDGVANPAL